MTTFHLRVVLTTVAVLVGSLTHAQDRMPPIPADKLTAEQQKAIAEFLALRNTTVMPGAFVPFLRSPEVMVRAGAIGEYLRYNSALLPHLSEFVIMVTARQMDNQYEWDVHYEIAVKAGVKANTLVAIANGTQPMLTADEQILYDLVDEQARTHKVSEATYRKVLERFGEKGMIDALSINGYYTLLATVMNAVQTPASGAGPTLKPLRR